ncbi:MAG: hypothetical protein SO401_00830 [Blautia sp.]|nr:hypothetical protein [Blautia sp.]
MGLYIPTFEEENEAKELRADIFEMIVKIRRPEELKKLRAFVKAFTKDDYKEEPLQLDEFIAYMDLPMVVRLKDLFKDEEPNLIVKQQVDELCAKAIESYSQAEGGEIE